MHVVLLTPASPPSLARYFDAADAERASRQGGNYGNAPTALTAALVDAGVRVTVVSHRRGHPEMRFTGPGLQLIQVASRDNARAQAFDMWRDERQLMVKIVETLNPDVVHAHWSYEWALAALKTKPSVPVVVTVRDAPLTVLRYHRDVYRVMRTLLAYRVRVGSRGTVFAANSPYMARAWARQMMDFRPLQILPNIAPSIDAPGVDRSTRPLVVEVAEAGRRKNVATLLEAFALVRGSKPAAELRLVGHGLGRHDDLASWARARGLGDGVDFIGPVDRAQTFANLAEAWLHVHAAREESFGNTLVEAMQLGTPVLGGAKSGAVPWVLDGGRAGALTDVTSASAMAAEILALLDDGPRRDRLADAARQRAQEVFSSIAVARQHVALYETLLSAALPRSAK